MLRWKCPHCDGACRVRTSRQQHPKYRVLYMQCMNPVCGWAGQGECCITKTVSPSGSPKPERYQDDMATSVPYQYIPPSDLFREDQEQEK